MSLYLKTFQQKKNLGPDCFTVTTFKKEIISILYKISNETEEGIVQGMVPNSCEASIILTPKTGKSTTKNENYRPTSFMNTDAKILNKTLAN